MDVQGNIICSHQVYWKTDTNKHQTLTWALVQNHIKINETDKISFQVSPRSINRDNRVPNIVEANFQDNAY